MDKIFLGIDIGATSVKVGCFDTGLKLFAKTAVPVQSDIEPETVVDRIYEASVKVLSEKALCLDHLEAIGVGSTGQFDLSAGFMISNPNLTLFQNVSLREMLIGKFSKAVVLENDGNAACYGEFVCGAGKDVENMVFFTLGTGIGGGIINEGKLVHGSADNAAELGHIIIYPDGRKCGCGQRGCVEAYASASSTARRAIDALEEGVDSSLQKLFAAKSQITCRDVFEHSADGDTFAREITDGTAKALAILCVNVLHTVEPEKIVFAGGMIGAGDFLLNRIKEFFDEQIWKLKKETVEICFATLGEDAGIIGAASLARDALREC